MDIRKLNEDQMYEYLKSLDNDERDLVNEEINNNLDEYSGDELYFLSIFSNAMKRINDDLMCREKFYFELYYLIDSDGNLTSLGQFYEYIFTHHYIKAVKMYMGFSDYLKSKNNVFRTNEKAIEYLKYFRNHIVDDMPSKVIKKDR